MPAARVADAVLPLLPVPLNEGASLAAPLAEDEPTTLREELVDAEGGTVAEAEASSPLRLTVSVAARAPEPEKSGVCEGGALTEYEGGGEKLPEGCALLEGVGSAEVSGRELAVAAKLADAGGVWDASRAVPEGTAVGVAQAVARAVADPAPLLAVAAPLPVPPLSPAVALAAPLPERATTVPLAVAVDSHPIEAVPGGAVGDAKRGVAVMLPLRVTAPASEAVAAAAGEREEDPVEAIESEGPTVNVNAADNVAPLKLLSLGSGERDGLPRGEDEGVLVLPPTAPAMILPVGCALSVAFPPPPLAHEDALQVRVALALVVELPLAEGQALPVAEGMAPLGDAVTQLLSSGEADGAPPEPVAQAVSLLVRDGAPE